MNDIMHLSEPGKKAYQYWMEIPGHFPFVSLDEFVIMPNHTHGLIIVDRPWDCNWGDAQISPGVETRHALSLQPRQPRQPEYPEQTGHALSLRQSEQSKQSGHPTPPHPRFRNPGKNTISSMVGSFKSAVTNWCNENKYPFGWQSRFRWILKPGNELYLVYSHNWLSSVIPTQGFDTLSRNAATKVIYTHQF